MKKISYEKRKSLYGWAFVSIWLLGMLLFFVTPFFKSLYYSFNTLQFNLDGNMEIIPGGLVHYIRLFREDSEFLPYLAGALKNMLYEVPAILMFSLFSAIVLNGKMRGRLFFRAVFFLPVIVMSGTVITLLGTGAASGLLNQSENVSLFADLSVLKDLLDGLGLGTSAVSFISGVVSKVISTCWKSGVQILLYLAALQSIPSQLYEVAKIEGATQWEIFWKVTFPMLLPILCMNVLYTIIDTFTFSGNQVMKYINTVSFYRFEYSYGCALSSVYSAIILTITVLIFGVMSLLNRTDERKVRR